MIQLSRVRGHGCHRTGAPVQACHWPSALARRRKGENLKIKSFVRRWNGRTEIATHRRVRWLGAASSKLYEEKRRASHLPPSALGNTPIELIYHGL